MEQTQGQSIEGHDDHWTVECPKCSKEFEYNGFFDPDDITKCECGTDFKTEKVWLDDDTYIR